MRPRALALALPLAALCACATSSKSGDASVFGPPAPPPGPTRAHLEDLQQQVDTLRGQLYLIATNALCHPEVQALMSEVVRACEGQSEPVCVDQRISFLISQVDPGGRFMTLMGSQPYSVFYPDPRRPGGPPVLDATQRRRLQRLAQPPWLPSTRFLVVANIDRTGNTSQPRRRASHAMDLLTKLDFAGFPGQHIRRDQVFGWVFRFKLQEGEFLRPIDRPPVRGASVDNSIWVFRTDCRVERAPETHHARTARAGAP